MLRRLLPVRLVLLGILLLAFALPVLAAPDLNELIPCADGNCGTDGGVADLPQGDFKESFLPTVAQLMLYAMATVAFVVFSAAGVMFVVGFGDQEETKKAKNVLVWGITGLVFAAAAYALVRGILNLNL